MVFLAEYTSELPEFFICSCATTMSLVKLVEVFISWLQEMFTSTYIVTLVVDKYMTKLVKKATATQSLDRSMHICLRIKILS